MMRICLAAIALLFSASVALAQQAQCFTQLYNADGTKNGSQQWFPCNAAAPMWTLNQAQRTVTITPGAATFAPTKAVMIGAAAACNIALQLVNDAAPTTWQNVQPGAILPVQAISIPAAGTTCTPILALY